MTGAARLSQPGAREEQAGTARPPLCHGLVRQDYSRTLNDFREKKRKERKGREGETKTVQEEGEGQGPQPGARGGAAQARAKVWERQGPPRGVQPRQEPGVRESKRVRGPGEAGAWGMLGTGRML